MTRLEVWKALLAKTPPYPPPKVLYPTATSKVRLVVRWWQRKRA